MQIFFMLEMLKNLFVWLVSWFGFGFVYMYSQNACLTYVSKYMLTFLVKIQIPMKKVQQEKGNEKLKVQKKSEEPDHDYYLIPNFSAVFKVVSKIMKGNLFDFISDSLITKISVTSAVLISFDIRRGNLFSCFCITNLALSLLYKRRFFRFNTKIQM